MSRFGVRELIEDESRAARLTELAARMGGGIAPSDAASEGGPAVVLAAVARAALLDESLPLARSTPTRPDLLEAASSSSLEALFPGVPRPSILSLSAGLLQMLDFWEESHHAAQEADDLGEEVFAPYWHGIAHRREPDPGNAAYWFRRVGRHRAFPAVAEAVAAIVGRREVPFLREGNWDPMGFVRSCGEPRPGSEDERIARGVQAAEMLALLDATAEGLLR